ASRRREHDEAREGRGAHGGDASTLCPETGPQPSARARIQNANSVAPNAQTTVAPVGRSNAADATTPSTLTSVPNAQPMRSFARTVRPSAMPASAGTIRYENTSSTPPILTELVTTTPNE